MDVRLGVQVEHIVSAEKTLLTVLLHKAVVMTQAVKVIDVVLVHNRHADGTYETVNVELRPRLQIKILTADNLFLAFKALNPR